MLKKNLILAVIISLIIGIFGGYFLRTCPKIVEKPPEKPAEDVITLKKSPLIQGWTALVSGEVKEISDRIVTLVSNGETLKISIAEDARILEYAPISREEIEKGIFPKTKEIELKDIKVGARVDITAQLVNQELRGISVAITPSVSVIPLLPSK